MNQIYYVGYDAMHPEDFKYDIPEGFPSYLLVITTTAALFEINGAALECPPHTAILYPPGHAIRYGASRQPYGNHWLRFASDESFVIDFPQPSTPFSISDPEYFRNLFQLLTWETAQMFCSSRAYNNSGIYTHTGDVFLKNREPDCAETNPILSQLIRTLFYKLHDELLSTQHSFHDHELLALRRNISASPQHPWNVTDMARQLHISAGHLQLIYKQKFHASCMDDVIHFRLFKAKDLLAHTTHSITEIASQCGYNSAEHFSRQFRQNTGLTPGQYRKNASVQKGGQAQ